MFRCLISLSTCPAEGYLSRWIRQEDRQETDLMTFSKSASLSLQTQDVKSEASLQQTALGWKRGVWVGVSLSSSALCIVWVAQLQTIFPGQKCASRGVYVLCARWGIRCLEETKPPRVFTLQKLPEKHHGEIPEMLSAPEQQKEDNHTHSYRFFIPLTASSRKWTSRVAKLAAVQVQLQL